LHDKYFSS